MSYAAPAAGGDGWTPAGSEGHLLIIEPQSHEHDIVTQFGSKDAIRATVHDIDTGETFDDSLIFPGGLIGALKARIGQKVLARLGRGVAKPGQAPPWQLVDASGDAAAVAQAQAFEAQQYQAPQPAAAAPAAPAAGSQEDAELAAARALLAQKGMTA